MTGDCEYPTERHPCRQQGDWNGRCYYHDKMVQGRIQPVRAYLSQVEIDKLGVG